MRFCKREPKIISITLTFVQTLINSFMKKTVLAISIISALTINTQIHGDIDPSFNPALQPTDSIIIQDDGEIVFGGGPKRLNVSGSFNATHTQLNSVLNQLIKAGATFIHSNK